VHAMSRAVSDGTTDTAAVGLIDDLFATQFDGKYAPNKFQGGSFWGYQATGALLGNYVLRQPDCSKPDNCQPAVLPDDPTNPSAGGTTTDGFDGEGRFRSHVGQIDDDPATPNETLTEIKDTRPTSSAAFYLIWYHPVAGVVEGTNVVPEGGLDGGTDVSAAVANPNVTG